METLSHHVNTQTPNLVFAAPQDANSSFDIWGVIGRRKWLLFLGLISGLLLGALFNSQCEPTFKSEAKVKIEPRKTTVMQITSTNPVAPLREDFEMRHDRLIGEHNIILKCVQENNFSDLDSFQTMALEEIVDYIKDNLQARPDREEKSLYSLKFYSPKQDEASEILNQLIHTYKTELDLEYNTEADRYKDLMKRASETFNNQFLVKTNELKTVQGTYDSPNLTHDTNIHQHALVELSKVISDTRKEINEFEVIKNETIASLESGPDAIKAQYYNLVQADYVKDFSMLEKDGNMSFMDMEIQKLKGSLAASKSRFGPGHPDVINLESQIEEMQKYRRESVKTNPLTVEDPQVSLTRFLSLIQRKIEIKQELLDRASKDHLRHSSEILRLNRITQEISRVKEEIEMIKKTMESINAKVIESDPSMNISNTARNEGFNFKVTQPASRGKQSWPILPLILSIGGVLGLLGGFGLASLVELADKTFHNPDEIIKQLNVPLIGHIPVITQNKRYLVENSLIEPAVCTYHRPKSQVAEAFRAVRTSLFFNTQGKQHSVIQVTSPTPGDGKSTLAANLAVSIAQSGKRVLLVDADMRRPRQANTFGITSKTGFASVLSGESAWQDVLYDCQEIEGLTLMPCGSKPSNPAELSSSPQVKELIEEMRMEFDFVIIDTPPLLAVTDACPIAARVDGVILCIRIKKNVRVSAERSVEMLSNLGANCIGLVVNGVGSQSGYGSQYTYGAYRAGYSYNGYGYGYGYGYGAGKYYEDDKPGQNGPKKAPRRIEDQRMESSSG